MKGRKVCVVTGTRAEYGLLRPIMNAIQEEGSLALQLLVTGMHLSFRHGRTINFIIEDGFYIDATVEMTPEGDSSFEMAESVGVGIVGMSKVFSALKPDVVLVLGDRVEALAASIAAVYMGIFVAHVHGGDSAEAGLDESARHAITKFAHIHFPATELSARRIRKMGEQDGRIFVTGAPGLDDIEKGCYPPREIVAEKFGLDLGKPTVLLVQHSVSTEPGLAGGQVRETLAALAELQFQTIAVYPNSDSGGGDIIEELESFRSSHPWFKLYQSIPRADYLGLMNTVSVMVGNSSSGIIETAPFRLPVVNIGNRQKGRERNVNVVDADSDRQSITHALDFVLYDREFGNSLRYLQNPCYPGGSGCRIVKVLSEIVLGEKLLKKKLTY